MNLIDPKISSSCLDGVVYDVRDKLLYVRFTDTQQVYAYSSVARPVAVELVTASSVGRYYTTSIKKIYDGRKSDRTLDEIRQEILDRKVRRSSPVSAGTEIFWYPGADLSNLLETVQVQ